MVQQVGYGEIVASEDWYTQSSHKKCRIEALRSLLVVYCLTVGYGEIVALDAPATGMSQYSQKCSIKALSAHCVKSFNKSERNFLCHVLPDGILGTNV